VKVDANWDGNEWTCRIDARAWRSLYASSDLEVVFLQPDEEHDRPPSTQQIGALARFVEAELILRPAVEGAIRAHYSRLRPRYLPHLEDPEGQMPEPLGGRDFKRLHELQRLYVHREVGASIHVGLSFRALWEIEHGVGVLTLENKVVSVGEADTAFLDAQ
jgi:hypothetical protein